MPKISDIYDPSPIDWQPLDAGKPRVCSDCGAPLGHPEDRTPHMIKGELCAYLCEACFDDWFGPFDAPPGYLSPRDLPEMPQ